MRKLIMIVGLIGVLVLFMLFISQRSETSGLPATVVLSGISPSEVKETIREHFKNTLKDGTRDVFDDIEYSLKTDYTDINGDKRDDLIVVYRSEVTCGSGGCLSAIFLQNESRVFRPTNFLYAVHNIKPLETITEGMRDLIINEDSIMKWNGVRYDLEESGR